MAGPSEVSVIRNSTSNYLFSLLSGMTLRALEHRDVAEIHWVLEWLVGLMAGVAFAICESAKIYRMAKRSELRIVSRRRCRVIDDGMANVAIGSDNFTGITDMLTVVTAETTRGIEMSYVVWMGFPISPHLWKEVSFIDSLHLADCSPDRVALALIELAIA